MGNSIAPTWRHAIGAIARMDFSMEAPMHKPVLLAAMVAALPTCAVAQDAAPAKSPAECTRVEEMPRAASALPARASTRAQPQLGSVAPNARVPSHAETPSLRAMRAASAKESGRAPGALDPTVQDDDKKP